MSGPAASSAPSAAVGPIGPGFRTARYTAPSAPNVGHGIRPLADDRQLHYNPPGQIPGPGGDYLAAERELTVTQSAVAEESPPLTLAEVAAGQLPWASVVPAPTARRHLRGAG